MASINENPTDKLIRQLIEENQALKLQLSSGKMPSQVDLSNAEGNFRRFLRQGFVRNFLCDGFILNALITCQLTRMFECNNVVIATVQPDTLNLALIFIDGPAPDKLPSWLLQTLELS